MIKWKHWLWKKKSQWTIYSKTPLNHYFVLHMHWVHVPMEVDPNCTCPHPGGALGMGYWGPLSFTLLCGPSSAHVPSRKVATNDIATRRWPSAAQQQASLGWRCSGFTPQLPENKFWPTEDKGLAESFLHRLVLTEGFLDCFSFQERPLTFAENRMPSHPLSLRNATVRYGFPFKWLLPPFLFLHIFLQLTHNANTSWAWLAEENRTCAHEKQLPSLSCPAKTATFPKTGFQTGALGSCFFFENRPSVWKPSFKEGEALLILPVLSCTSIPPANVTQPPEQNCLPVVT